MKLNYNIYNKEYAETLKEQELKKAEMDIINNIMQQQISEYKITRPKEKIWKNTLMLIFKALLTICITMLIKPFVPDILFLVILFINIAVFLVLNIKRLILTLIIAYQKYAPESIRSACLFEPCCSEYMKRSIEKYGVIKGLQKGIKRISRCHYPNGGIDEP